MTKLDRMYWKVTDVFFSFPLSVIPKRIRLQPKSVFYKESCGGTEGLYSDGRWGATEGTPYHK